MNYGAIPASVYNAVKGQTVRYAIFPALVPANIATVSGGVKIESGHNAWSAYVDIVPIVAGIATDYWICAGKVHAVEDSAIHDIQMADATPTVLAEFIVDPTAVTINVDLLSLPFPIFMTANSLVQAHGTTSGGAIKDIYFGILYATLL